jgi:hypothetical protein
VNIPDVSIKAGKHVARLVINGTATLVRFAGDDGATPSTELSVTFYKKPGDDNYNTFIAIGIFAVIGAIAMTYVGLGQYYRKKRK